MKIKYLEITKYKNLEDIKLDFSTKLISLLIGKNGLGKSNLLEAIAYIFSTIDLAEKETEFTTSTSSDFFEFKIEYECKKHFVSFSNLKGILTINIKSDKA